MTEHKKSIIILLGVVIVLFAISNVSSLTGSIGNAKMILYPEVNGWLTTTIEKTILVKNINNETVNITLKTDEDGSEFLDVIDSNFILNSGEEKKAQFLVKVKKEETYEGKINVFFSPIEKKGPGVVLSSSIIVVAKKDQDYDEPVKKEDSDDIKENNLDPITGGAIGTSKQNRELVFLSVSGIILLIAFVGLMILTKNKRVTKKGGKVNARKKS